MRMQPAFFEVMEPMRVLVAVGCSDSNAWYGASRVIETRYEARNALPGSIFHSLPGGTFLQDPDGTLHEARLRRPRPPMEKAHGLPHTDADRLDGMLKAGRLREAPRPAVADYAAARARGSVRLPPLRGGTLVVEESAELAAFRADVAALAEALEADGANLRYEDLGENDTVHLRIAYPGTSAGIGRSAIDMGTWAHGSLPDASPLAEGFSAISGRGRRPRDEFMERAEAAMAPAPGPAPR